MSAAARAGAAAAARMIDRIAAAAGEELPEGVDAERVDGGVLLTGPRLLPRWLTDARLRGLAITVARNAR